MLIKIPPSKSEMHRVLICASLSFGQSIIKNPLICDDTERTRKILEQCGARFEFDDSANLKICGISGFPHPDSLVSCEVGLSGATLRFLLSICAAGQGIYRFSGNQRMNLRPLAPLLETLAMNGANFEFSDEISKLPFILYSNGLRGGKIKVDASQSGQFLSSLLLASPLMDASAEISASSNSIASFPYILMTVDIMRKFGISVGVEKYYVDEWIPADIDKYNSEEGTIRFQIESQSYKCADFEIEGDWSSASPFLAFGVLQKKVIIEGLRKDSYQADSIFIDILSRMGASIAWDEESGFLVISPSSHLRPLTVDLRQSPDLLPVLAVLCAQVSGRSILTGLCNARGKESDRVSTISTTLTALGVSIQESINTLIIDGGLDLHLAIQNSSATFKLRTMDDHRLAMAYALFAKRDRIDNPECVSKSFPHFWDLWDQICTN